MKMACISLNADCYTSQGIAQYHVFLRVHNGLYQLREALRSGKRVSHHLVEGAWRAETAR